MAATQNDPAEFAIEDGVLIVRYPAKKIDLKTATGIVTDRKEFAKHIAYPVMADVRKVKSVTAQAREYLSSADAVAGVIAGAVLSGSSFTVFIANFFLKVNRPRIPTRLFTAEADAMKWLQQFKK